MKGDRGAPGLKGEKGDKGDGTVTVRVRHIASQPSGGRTNLQKCNATFPESKNIRNNDVIPCACSLTLGRRVASPDKRFLLLFVSPTNMDIFAPFLQNCGDR